MHQNVLVLIASKPIHLRVEINSALSVDRWIKRYSQLTWPHKLLAIVLWVQNLRFTLLLGDSGDLECFFELALLHQSPVMPAVLDLKLVKKVDLCCLLCLLMHF